MRAADVMTNEVITVGEDASVQEAAKLLAEHGISAVPVVDRDKIAADFSKGVLTITLPKTAAMQQQQKIEIKSA